MVDFDDGRMQLKTPLQGTSYASLGTAKKNKQSGRFGQGTARSATDYILARGGRPARGVGPHLEAEKKRYKFRPKGGYVRDIG